MDVLINPATGKKLDPKPRHTSEEARMIIDSSYKAYSTWKNVPVKERSILIGRVGEVLLARKNELALTCTQEMGKPLKESIAEVEKCASVCKYYAENAEEFLKDDVIKTEGSESYVIKRPLGPVLAVMPWNFPYWQVMRFAAPGLCAGNSALLKHSSNVPGCALHLEAVFKEAGLPENVFRTLLIPSYEVEAVIRNPKVVAVTLTGSTAAGRKVSAVAGECLKKVVLELGGSDPYLILADADLEMAASTLVKGRMLNAGQSCISPKRLIIVKSVYEKFKTLVIAEMKKVSYGDPMMDATGIGPMARFELRDELSEQVQKSIAAGAELVMGGKIPLNEGAYYPPTILGQVRPGMAAFDEELFGPVVILICAHDENDAVLLANMSPYGLGGGIFTNDLQKARELAEKGLETGGVFINDFLKSDPRLPFGGVKESGHGRELSRLGINEFINHKTIFFK
jgi:succinate-semialdehyde dehydrogenase/glutarate-semialdehyde dehydrogenase